MALDPIVQCHCAQCAQHSDGYVYQKKSLMKRHAKQFPAKAARSVAQLPEDDVHRAAPQHLILRELTNNTRANQAPNPQIRLERAPSIPRTPSPEIQARLREHAQDRNEQNLDEFGQHNEFENDEPYAPQLPQPDHPEPRAPEPPEPPHPEPRAHEEIPAAPRQDRHFRAVEQPSIPSPGSDQSQGDRPSLIPLAYKSNEDPAVRMAYLSAVIGNVYGHLTVLQATDQLNNTLNALLVAGALPDHPRPVRHLISAKRRLGIDPDQWVIPYALCPVCWKHHSPAQLEQLNSASCTVPGCEGIIYSDTQGAKKQRIRTAALICPQVSIIASLRRMFLRPGFAKSLRDSRNDVFGKNADEQFVMTDIHDGDAWNQSRTGHVRHVGENGTVRDAPPEGQPATKNLNSHRYGLHLTMNGDW